MANINTKTIEYKSFYLSKIAEKATELSLIINEISKSKSIVDICKQEVLALALSKSEDKEAVQSMEVYAKKKLEDAECEFKRLIDKNYLIEARIKALKEETNLLGIEVMKFTKD